MERLWLPCLVACFLFSSGAAVKFRLGLKAPATRGDEVKPVDEWFTQRLDHFDPTNNQTWRQRYRSRTSWFKVGSKAPVFLLIGGEDEIDWRWMASGTWLDYAEDHEALCFQLEHRFYGESRPTQNMSADYLFLLNSEQALADMAYFIQGIKSKYNLTDGNKWVVFGGSYPGSLAAWARMKYPHLVHAAVSSSSPLLAKINFPEYYNIVAKSLDASIPGCAGAVREAADQINQVLKTDNGSDVIFNKFNLCHPPDPSSSDDVTILFEHLADMMGGVVQENMNNMAIPQPTATNSISKTCKIMTDPIFGTPLDRIAYLSRKALARDGFDCMEIKYSEKIEGLKNASWEEHEEGSNRQWMYQTCTEFGFYQTSEATTSLFGNTLPLEWFTKQCKEVFGLWLNNKLLKGDIFRTNNNYGGLKLAVSRVVFVYGSVDPWHALGKLHSDSSKTPSILIEGTAHCADMYPERFSDPPQLTDARKKIKKYLDHWLQAKEPL